MSENFFNTESLKDRKKKEKEVDNQKITTPPAQEEEKTVAVLIRLSPKTKRALKTAVSKEGLTYGQFIEKILREQYTQILD